MELKNKSMIYRLQKDFKKNMVLYIMLLPAIVYLAIFCYGPMYGAIIAFKNFKPRLGILQSEWVGFKYFEEYMGSVYFGRTFRNTLVLNILNLLFGFPVPIIFAILLNEVRNIRYKRVIQTITYLPHFITTIVIVSIVTSFTDAEGVITGLVNLATGHEGSLLADKDYFRPIYIISGIWQSFGWGSIVYLAAITGINQELYDAARIDGANKLQQIIHVTIAGIRPTIVIMLILRIGSIMSIGWEKAFLLQSPLTYETSDIISTYVYRKGIEEANYSYSAAVGLFNSIVNFVLVMIGNSASRKLNDTALW